MNLNDLYEFLHAQITLLYNYSAVPCVSFKPLLYLQLLELKLLDKEQLNVYETVPFNLSFWEGGWGK